MHSPPPSHLTAPPSHSIRFKLPCLLGTFNLPPIRLKPFPQFPHLDIPLLSPLEFIKILQLRRPILPLLRHVIGFLLARDSDKSVFVGLGTQAFES